MSNPKPGSVNVLDKIIVLNEGETLKSVSQTHKGEANKPVILNKLMSKKNYIEMEEHPDLISPAHAVPSSNTEGMSDDDGTKVILTLDTVESPIKDSDMHSSLNFIEIAEIKAEFDDPPAEHFVQQKNGTTGKQAISTSTEISELAKRQLQQLSYANPKKRALKTQMLHALEDEDPLRISESEAPETAVKELKKVSGRTTNLMLTKVKTEKLYAEGQKDDKQEIAKNEDLIAILEGPLDNADDEPENIEEYELVTVTESAEPEASSKQLELSKEEIKKIAAQQLMSIPNRQRGRKPRDATKTDPPKNEIVKSLVSDWSDTEKDADMKPAIVHVEKKVIKKEKDVPKVPVESPIVPFRRTRVIKKKIIWDPDAPETQISYASLIQSSAKKTVKKPAPKPITSTPKPASPANVKKVEVKVNRTKSNATPPNADSKVKILNSLKRRSETPPNLLNKKKKVTSEVDRLLSDEGVANMVHSLESESPPQKEIKGMKKLTVNLEKTPIKKEPVVKKRQTKQSASSSWDYVYNQKNDDSLIIRRRSNSSYSSASPRRLSIDHTPNNARQTGAKTRNFEFARPGLKKITKTTPGSTPASASPADRSPVEIRKSTRGSNTPEVKEEVSPQRMSGGDLSVKRHGDVVQLILKPKVEKVKNTFPVELMKSVTNELNNLQKDNACKVVIITVAGPHFCQGIDFLPLTQGTIDKRKAAANELANCTKNFLLSLASFTKPLLAGVTGSCSGLGVTMLPLFDVVIASDKCTFETPYAKIGQLPEGYSVLSMTNNVRHNFKTKLIYLCEKLNATEAALGGLVTKIEIPVKVTEETLQCAKKIASLSQQTFASVKMQRRKGELEKLNAALNEEFKMIVQHWTGSECFEKFKHYLLTESW